LRLAGHRGRLAQFGRRRAHLTSVGFQLGLAATGMGCELLVPA